MLGNIREEYIEDQKKSKLKKSIYGCILGIIFVPFGSIIDWFIYPSFFFEFSIARLWCALLILFIMTLHYTKSAKHNIQYLYFSWIILLQVILCWIISVTDGHLSTYYASLSVVIFASVILLSLETIEIMVLSIITLVLYVLAAFKSPLNQPEIFYNNVYFIFLSSVISIFASYLNSRQRFREFCLNKELEEKNYRLIALDEIKTCFFSNISHEFRTPLSLITGPINDVLKDYQNNTLDKMKPNLQLIQQNSSRLMRLINNLLDVMKLDEKKYKINPQVIEMNSFIEGLVDSVSYSANLKDITVTKIVPEDKSYIYADFDAMEKIVLNILTNAIKFTDDQGQIHVEVNNSNDQILIAVQDNGIGISEENLSYIFDRFKQVDDSHTRKHQGSGLGLALVKDLIMLQNGEIEVESELNKGSRFILKFPKTSKELNQNCHNNLHKIDKLDLDNAKLTYDNNVQNPLRCDEKTILIVDDEPDMMFYIKNIFLDKNFNILCASDGQQALNMIQEHNPDLVILDLMMPEIDGLSVCKKLKEDDKTKLIKVLMLTAKSDEESKIMALKYGCDDFITKPFSSDEIVTRVENMLDASQLNRDLFQELERTIKRLNMAQDTLLKSDKLSAALDIPTSTLQEIKHPLGYCIAALYSLKIDPLVMKDENLSEAILEIEESIESINHIISDIKSFTVPKDCDIKKFAIKEVITESLDFISKSELENIEVSINISEDLQVIASKTHIGLVIVDLIRSAIKNINKSKRDGKITIIVKNESPGKAVISVIDDGLKISEEDLAFIFKPLFDFQSLQKGVEMGLNTSYLIIKEHNSELKVVNELEKGNELSFVLPVW